MPKLGIFSGAEVCDILRSQGFELVRQRGSHMVMQRRVGDTTITVPVRAQSPRDPGWHVAIHHPADPVVQGTLHPLRIRLPPIATLAACAGSGTPSIA